MLQPLTNPIPTRAASKETQQSLCTLGVYGVVAKYNAKRYFFAIFSNSSSDFDPELTKLVVTTSRPRANLQKSAWPFKKITKLLFATETLL